MPVNFSIRWRDCILVIVLSLSLGCSSAGGGSDKPATLISERQGLEISRKAAEKRGYDLKRYELDTFGDPTGGSDKEWLFTYLCSPGPPPPGCSFMVVIDRRTGNTRIYSGE